MAKKKVAPKKKAPAKKGPGKSDFVRAGVSILLLVILIVGVGVLVYRWKGSSGSTPVAPGALKKDRPWSYPSETAPAPDKRTQAAPKPKIEPQKTPEAIPGPLVVPDKVLPRVAIVVDDMGSNLDVARGFMDLSAPLTLSVLPFQAHGEKIASLAKEKGFEVLLHLPMEPDGYPDHDPGPGALFVSMKTDILLETLNKDLLAMPLARGVNNHMGSRMTSSPECLNPIFTVLKKRGLFFLDSRTTSRSQCRESARLLQLPFVENDLFLDNNKDKETISKQVRELIRLAKKRGFAVGICHSHPATLATLARLLPRIRTQVKIVPVSQLARIPE